MRVRAFSLPTCTDLAYRRLHKRMRRRALQASRDGAEYSSGVRSDVSVAVARGRQAIRAAMQNPSEASSQSHSRRAFGRIHAFQWVPVHPGARMHTVIRRAKNQLQRRIDCID